MSAEDFLGRRMQQPRKFIPDEARFVPLSPEDAQRGPYKVTDRRLLSDQFQMRFYIDGVVNPKGETGEQRWVEFTRPGALVFAVDPERYLWMIEVYQYAANRTTLEVPGGTIFENDTDGSQTVRAKALEEAGVTIQSVQELHPQHPQRVLTSRVDHQSRVFLAVVDSTGAKPIEPDVLGVRRVPFDEVYEQAMTGELDSPSIAVEILRMRPLVDSITPPKEPKS